MELNTEINLVKEQEQNEFINSTLWKTINNGVDIGIRYLFPDLIEEEIIELKNNLINFGLKDGIKKSIDSVIETGKEISGIMTGNFENITQIQKTIKNGGVIDKISDIMDWVIEKSVKNGKINYNVGKTLKKGKVSILSSIEKNIESTLNDQITSAKNIDKYISNWNNFYNLKDFNGMQKEYIKMEKELEKLIPLENTIKNARYVENIHNLIKNNGKNFELNEEIKELASKL